MKVLHIITTAVLLIILSGCAAESGKEGPDPAKPGKFKTGTAMMYFEIPGRTDFFEEESPKIIPARLWYPANAEGLRPMPFKNFLPEEFRDISLSDMMSFWTDGEISDAPESLANLETASFENAPPDKSEGTYELIIFSHGDGEMSFSWYTLCESLASRGYVVAAPDHTGNACASSVPGVYYPYDSGTLVNFNYFEERKSDVLDLIDCLEKENISGSVLKGMINTASTGVMGHSYGALTAVGVVKNDSRIKCALPVAAAYYPDTAYTSNMVKSPKPLDIDKPMMFWAAEFESSTIPLGGNANMRDCYGNSIGRAYYLNLLKADHWTFTDICAVNPEHEQGCAGREIIGSDPYGNPGDFIEFQDQESVRPVFDFYSAVFFGRYLKDYTNYSSYLKENPFPESIEYEFK